MTKVINSTSSKTFSNNEPNIVEVNKDNIIESDSEFREVVKKGYLLNNINLSTIPDIIQEAIDNAILDAKTQTLADSLISTMRQTIENFDDGVYKKTYIDTTITYLEQLLTQKVSPEVAASIAEAKIAVATAEFATASQVNNLSSRVGNSESEIINIKETITTKDTARATQIEELQASINQSLSNYSEAIDLYVDVDGIVKSQKIEKLEAGNSISKVTINELNEVVVDENGNYNAMVAKVIFDSDGKIVGFNFSDTNELTTFTINADVFKIANSTNTKTPFTIVGNELLIDGKVSFSNITDKSNVITMENVETAIRDNVTVIDGNKIATASIFAHQIDADAINGKNIRGGTIIGTQIIGSVIKGSYIDLTSTLALTNWQNFTLTTIPEQYADNFAHYNDGALTVDSQGYVRLAGQQNFLIPPIIQGGTIWSGNLSNVHASPSLAINKKWELYSWNSYNINTLQRSIRNDTQFSSSGRLIFSGSCICDDFDNTGTDTVNYGVYNYRVLDTDIKVWIQASNGNGHTAEIAIIKFNGIQVAYGNGRYGEQSGEDRASLDFNSNIKGLPINIKVLFNGGASFWFTSTISITANNTIQNHTINDSFTIDSISHTLNSAGTGGVGTTTCAYNINYPSLWVQ